jgi:hypothetical protein
LYETPPVAVEALLRVEELPHVLWDSACGPGSLVRVLRAAGHMVHATDLVDYGLGEDSRSGIDFLMQSAAPPGVEGIITNPPGRLADKFVRHAITLAPPFVVMLLRLAFLESVRRSDILESGSGLARIHVFRNRLPMMHRHGWAGPRASSAIPFAWFVWEHGYGGRPEVNRISWKSAP